MSCAFWIMKISTSWSSLFSFQRCGEIVFIAYVVEYFIIMFDDVCTVLSSLFFWCPCMAINGAPFSYRNSSRQKGLGRSAEQNRGLGGDIRLKSGPYLVLFVLLHGGRPGSGRPRTFLENILPQEIYQLLSDLYLQCFHVLRKCTPGDMAAYLHRVLSGGIGHRRYYYLKGYDCDPNSIVRNNEERSWAPRRFSWYRAT